LFRRCIVYESFPYGLRKTPEDRIQRTKMKKESIHIHYTEYKNPGELAQEDKQLLSQAGLAAANAYAPYSGFRVGAAVMLENGVVVTGNNQENAAYPSGLCAERVALFSASAQYPDVPVSAIAITARTAGAIIDYPVPPCGACRQVIAEYENHHSKAIRLIISGESGKVLIFDDIAALLPFGFNASQLNPGR
jgi:cytidine deaminase